MSEGGRARAVTAVATLFPFFLYVAITIALIGRPVIGHLGSVAMGARGDPAAFIWFLKWWQEILSHGWGPMHSSLVWAPEGFNMNWTPTMPAAGVLLAPLTAAAGPIVSYNTLILIAPGLSGWAAFALCRTVGASYLPSVAGGYFLAFSSYVMGHAPAHPNFSLLAVVPLATALVVRRLQARIDRRPFVALLAVLLTVQFLLATEIFLTMTVVGACCLGLAALLYRERRAELRETTLLIALAYAISSVVVSPFLWASLSDPNSLTTLDPFLLSFDPLSLLVPTELTLLGGSWFSSISHRFSAPPGELGSYLGPVLIAMLGWFAWERRRERGTAILFGALGVALLLAMGPRLDVLGHITAIRLPWSAFVHLPVTKLALPVRILLFAWIPIAVAVALWLSRGSRWRWAVAVLAAATLLPNTSYEVPPIPYVQPSTNAAFWHSARPVPRFFTDGRAKRLLDGDNVLVVPYGWANDSEDMLWQAEADMSFDMPEAYLGGTIPPNFLCWTVADHLLAGSYPASDHRELLAFLAVKRVDAVVVGDRFAPSAARLFSILGRGRELDGVRLYRVPPRPAPAAACPAS